MSIGTVIGVVLIGLFALIWLVYLALNAWRVFGVMRLEGSDKPDNRAWAVWGLSLGSLFAGCVLAAITWVVMEWVMRPLDPFEDSVGTIQLFTSARGNVGFVLVSNVVLVIASVLVYQSV